jgi:hypothetical protein
VSTGLHKVRYEDDTLETLDLSKEIYRREQVCTVASCSFSHTEQRPGSLSSSTRHSLTELPL